MSLRIDTSEWISGSLIIGETGLGVLGSAIPSGGESGAGYTYNDLSLPTDATKEICGRITTWPSAGTLFAYEDTSFEFTSAPNGVYTFQYQLYVDGVAVGSPTTVTLTVGGGAVHASTASLISSSATLTSTAARVGAPLNHAATGSMAASAAAISGVSSIRATHAASGAMAAESAMISGAAAIRIIHDASGTLTASSATLYGTAAIRVIHDASGTLVASGASLSGATSRGSDSWILRSAKKLFVKSSSQNTIVVRRKKALTITTGNT